MHFANGTLFLRNKFMGGSCFNRILMVYFTYQHLIRGFRSHMLHSNMNSKFLCVFFLINIFFMFCVFYIALAVKRSFNYSILSWKLSTVFFVKISRKYLSYLIRCLQIIIKLFVLKLIWNPQFHLLTSLIHYEK